MLKKVCAVTLILAATAGLTTEAQALLGWNPPLDSDGNKTWGILRKKNDEQLAKSSHRNASQSAYSFNTAYKASSQKLYNYKQKLEKLFADQSAAHTAIDHKYANEYNRFFKRYEKAVDHPVDGGTLAGLKWTPPKLPVITCNKDTSKADIEVFRCLPPINSVPYRGKSTKTVLAEQYNRADGEPQKMNPRSRFRFRGLYSQPMNRQQQTYNPDGGYGPSNNRDQDNNGIDDNFENFNSYQNPNPNELNDNSLEASDLNNTPSLYNDQNINGTPDNQDYSRNTWRGADTNNFY